MSPSSLAGTLCVAPVVPATGSTTISAADAGTSTCALSSTVVPGKPRRSPDDDGSSTSLRLAYAGAVSRTSRSPTSGTLDSSAPSYGAGGASTSRRQPFSITRGATAISATLAASAPSAHKRARGTSLAGNSALGSTEASFSLVAWTSASTSSGDGAPGRDAGAATSSTDDNR